MRVAFGFATRQRLASAFRYGFAGLLLCTIPLLTPSAARAADSCNNGRELTPKQGGGIGVTDNPADSAADLEVNGPCTIQQGGDYYFAKVNVTNGGVLTFKEMPNAQDKVVNFWAKSIIVENGGTIKAGVAPENSYGTHGYTLNVILYGQDLSDNDPINKAAGGDTCIQANCGVPSAMWADNGKTRYDGCGEDKGNAGANCLPGQPTTFKDYFYQYGQVYGTTAGHYGYKVLAVGYGGALQLRGYKGTSGGDIADNRTIDSTKWTVGQAQTATGTSWLRLAAHLAAGDQSLTVERPVGDDGKTPIGLDWLPGDKIVVTTTDYLPSHSEELTIAAGNDAVKDGTVKVVEGMRWSHVGKAFDLGRLKNASKGFKDAFPGGTPPQSAETRAAVALLTRSIRIVSGGDVAGDYFDCHKIGDKWYIPKKLTQTPNVDVLVPNVTINSRTVLGCATARYKTQNKDYYFGGHTTFRQGFKQLQLQGVEFHQMGQGGRMSHYPVHFHMARMVAPKTYVKDSSVSESMTRWFVLHSTLGVLLQRNVGWKSIGHGYYLEEATETDNKFYSNIGILARAAVKGPDSVTDPRDNLNPRNVPGILAINKGGLKDHVYRSDVIYPTLFWITNGWNEFVGNMAAGAGTCGMCYWFVPAANNDMMEVPPTPGTMKHMRWTGFGYAGRQTIRNNEGDTPVKQFYKNYCTTAMHSLNTSNGVTNPCLGVVFPSESGGNIVQVQSIAPGPPAGTADQQKKIQMQMDMYYPKNEFADNRRPTVCDPEAPEESGIKGCLGKYNETTGEYFNNDIGPKGSAPQCANGNPTSCAVTVIDSYTTSFHWAQTNFSAVWLRTPGWFLLDNSFISDVQNGGVTFVSGGDYSRSSAPLGYWTLATRSVFAGQTQLDTSKYALASGPRNDAGSDIGCVKNVGDRCVSVKDSISFPLTTWATGQRLFNIYDGPAHQDANAYLDIKESPCDDNKKCMYLGTPGVRKYLGNDSPGYTSYLPNAAIGWKQPNGFYYPPAFRSTNLFFDKVNIRHYVIQPLFKYGTYQTDDQRAQHEFVGINTQQTGLFTGFTDVDRQTVLNDDDGSLTGFSNTISVNQDGFFAAPLQTTQCKSDLGVDPTNACRGGIAKTPPTARTSPYDYVTTAIFPGCAVDDRDLPKEKQLGDKPYDNVPPPNPQWADAACGSQHEDKPDTSKPGSRFSAKAGQGGIWSRSCSGPYCFGVPIYRQYLMGDKTKGDREWATWNANQCGKDGRDNDGKTKAGCDFPFARMSGAAQWQRDVLTVNNGKFYIDTTHSGKFQRETEQLGKKGNAADVYIECSMRPESGDCQPRSVNVFEKGKTYFVFFLFPKKDTKQVYQIWVGKSFNTNTDFKGINIAKVEGRFKYKDWTGIPWKPELIEGPDGVRDVLEVPVDFSKIKDKDNLFDPNPNTAKNVITCKPVSFCEWKGAKSCGCSLKSTDLRVKANPDLMKLCQNTCKTWAVKDLDAPKDPDLTPPDLPDSVVPPEPEVARFGFAFTMREDPDDKSHRPPPVETKSDPVWATLGFSQPTKEASAGAECTYKPEQTPGAAACPVQDCPMGETNPPMCDKK